METSGEIWKSFLPARKALEFSRRIFEANVEEKFGNFVSNFGSFSGNFAQGVASTLSPVSASFTVSQGPRATLLKMEVFALNSCELGKIKSTAF